MRFALLSIFIAAILIGCIFKDDKLVSKKVTNGDICIKWYHYSYITNLSSDFVDVSKGDSSCLIYESVDVITNVFMNNDSIILRLFKPERGIVHTKNMLSEIFGYKIIMDSTANHDEYTRRPHAVKEDSYIH